MKAVRFGELIDFVSVGWWNKHVIQLRTLALMFVCLLAFARYSSAATTYVSQSGGTFSGGSACNGQTAESVATFNSSQTASATYELCGVITTPLAVQANS